MMGDDAAQDSESAASALRRVSFSKTGGAVPTKTQEQGEDSGSSGVNEARLHDKIGTGGPTHAEGGIEPGSSTTSPKPNQPLPNLQQRRRSSQSMGGLGKPAPPRPPGNPPPMSQDQIRRYSISNEISGGYDFSRRMSMVGPPSGGEAPSSLTGNNAANVENNSVGKGGGGDVATKPSIGAVNGHPSRASNLGGNSNSNDNNSGKEGRRQSKPELEGRAAVLWYNMGVTKQKERDARGAVECYERAVKDGHAKAQHNLAAIYEKGVPGVPKDDAEAVRLFRLAAEQGLAESSYSLAMHLKFGLGDDRTFLVLNMCLRNVPFE